MIKYTAKPEYAGRLVMPEMGYEPSNRALAEDILKEFFGPANINDSNELVRVAREQYPYVVRYEEQPVANIFISGFYFPVSMFNAEEL